MENVDLERVNELLKGFSIVNIALAIDKLDVLHVSFQLTNSRGKTMFICAKDPSIALLTR